MVGRRSISKPLDSPSRQLVYDLAKDLEAIRLHHEDLKRVYNYQAQAQEEEETDRKSTLPQHMPEGDSKLTSNDESSKGKGKEGEGDFNEVPL